MNVLCLQAAQRIICAWYWTSGKKIVCALTTRRSLWNQPKNDGSIEVRSLQPSACGTGNSCSAWLVLKKDVTDGAKKKLCPLWRWEREIAEKSQNEQRSWRPKKRTWCKCPKTSDCIIWKEKKKEEYSQIFSVFASKIIQTHWTEAQLHAPGLWLDTKKYYGQLLRLTAETKRKYERMHICPQRNFS